MSEVIVELHHAHIYQGKNLILQDVNLSVNKGEFVYLVGKTGTGKSSLLKTLYGDLPFKDGEGLEKSSISPQKPGCGIPGFSIADRQECKRQPEICFASNWLDRREIDG